MSKVVSGIGNAVSGVVKGAVKAVSSVTSGIGGLAKSLTSSSLGKAIVMAAAIYFGGAALSGGFGAAEGTTFLEGMGQGVSSAANSLSSGWSSAFGSSGAAAGETAAGGAGGAGGWTQTPGGMNVLANEAGGGAADVAGKGFFSSDLAKYGAITAGTQVAGGLISGAGQQKALQDQRDYEAQMAQQARDRVNSNVGASVWGGPGGVAAPAAYRPGAPVPTNGLVARSMTPGAPAAPGAAAAYQPYQPYQFDPMNYRTV
jgi:hypothetical protein